MKKNFVVFIDSGIGGLSTLALAKTMISSNIIYYADNLHAPYGKHSHEEIDEYLINIISHLKQKHDISIVVLACNTATTSSIQKLRETFKEITFIGTEPAIMLAKTRGFDNIACIATTTTINQIKYKSLCEKTNMKIRSIPLPNFAMLIENYFSAPTILNRFEILKTIFFIKSKLDGCECLVLGCTHYVLIKDFLEKYLSLPLLDGNHGVCKMLKKNISGIENNTLKFYFSDYNPKLKRKYIKILNQTLAKL